MNDSIIFKDGDVYINLPFLIGALSETIEYGHETLVDATAQARNRVMDVLSGMETVLGSLKTFNELGKGIDN